MKKIFIALAAMAAVVGCSKETATIEASHKETISIDASIDLNDTRVAVEGEKFTEVSWEQGDVVMLASATGGVARLAAEESGRSVVFVGEGDAMADVDTYYATYPAVEIVDAKATYELAEQSGDDAAVLVAMAEDQSKSRIAMTFKPANALLHVAVSGVESLAKAEFKAFDGAMLASSFTYDFASDVVATAGETASYSVSNPAAEGFFFSLPADMDMANGYIVTLTDAAGNVCSKAYNGRTFERGTTTRVTIEWSTPSVSLGTPMTSYSYYATGDSATANSCANNVIYSDASFSGIQAAMIAEAGYIINGEYVVASIDSASKTIGNVTVSSWGEKSVQAYIKTKGGEEFKSADVATVHITGLPYSYNFVGGSLDAYRNAGWSTNGTLRVSNESLVGRASTLVLNHRRYSKVFVVLFNEHEKGFVVSPKFNVPASVMVQPAIAHSSYNATGNLERTTYVGPVANTTTSNTSSVSFKTTGGSSTGGSVHGQGVWQSAFELSTSNPYISVDCNDVTSNNLGAYYFLHEVAFRYAE